MRRDIERVTERTTERDRAQPDVRESGFLYAFARYTAFLSFGWECLTMAQWFTHLTNAPNYPVPPYI